MAQGSRSRRIDSHVHLLRKSKLCQLPVLFGKWLDLDDPPVGSFYERVFTPPRLFWLFLAQVLSSDRSCREAVQMAQAWIAVEQGDLVCTSTSAYCQGRQRLPTDWLSKLSNGILEQLASTLAGQYTWFGFRVKVVDGTTVSLADTPANQKPYRQSSRQKPGCGFPLMRLACSFCLGSGALLAWVYGGLRDSERTLWHRLWNGFSVGDLVITDRGFCGYADIWSLSQRGVHSVMRANGRRSAGVREVRRLGKKDRLVEWTRSIRPKWMDKATWQSVPQTMILREINYTVAIPGLRTKSVTVVTTLLDEHEYPAEAFAELYRRRWMVELFLRDIKISMGMDHLRCKSPAMADKELLMHIIAYNLIRALMLDAAQNYPIDPTSLSFKGAVGLIRQWAPLLAALSSKQKRQDMEKMLLYYIAHTVVTRRPNRSEPRALKRRPKNYQLLNKPRQQFNEIPHRTRYKKAKS